MEYVRHLYTEEELKTLFKWFDAQVLPDTMQLDNATYIPDVRETLSRLKDQAVLCRENPKMQGCIIFIICTCNNSMFCHISIPGKIPYIAAKSSLSANNGTVT